MADERATPAEEMTREQLDDFVNEMYWLVQEGGHVWEAPMEALTDFLPAM